MKLLQAKLFAVIFFALFSCKQTRDLSIEKSAFCKGAQVATDSLAIRLNLACEKSYEDHTPPLTFAFPAATEAGAYPAQVALNVNTTGATTYTTTDNSAVTTASSVYSTAIPISADTVLRYFSSDSAGNAEQPKVETYKAIAGAPTVVLSNLTASGVNATAGYVNASATYSIDVLSDTTGTVQVRAGGTGKVNEGDELANVAITSGVPVTIPLTATQLRAGTNKLFVIVSSGDKSAFSSFYIYLDENPPYVQASPDSLSANSGRVLTLSTVEPSTIYYNLTTDGSAPADPSQASTLYAASIALPLSAGNEIPYKIKFIAYDRAGNASDIVTKTYDIDGLAPTITSGVDVPFHLIATTYYVSSASSATVNSFNLRWQSDQACTYTIEIGGTSQGAGENLRSGTCSAGVDVVNGIPGSELKPGGNTIRIYARDAAGNIGFDTISVSRDDTAQTPNAIKPLLAAANRTIAANNMDFVFTDMSSYEITGAGVDFYELQVSSDFAFTAPTLYTSGTGTPTMFPTCPGTGKCSTQHTVAAGKWYWRVRMTDNVGNAAAWSAPKHFYVGRSTGDMNGDGFDEVAVGSPGLNCSSTAIQGKAYIFLGGGAGPRVCGAASCSAASYANRIEISGDAAGGDCFGSSLTLLEDINGGGRADLIIGAPYFDAPGKTDSGRVYIFLGENLNSAGNCNNTYPCSLNISNADLTLTGVAGGDRYGAAVAHAGDFNKDGISDFAVSAPNATGGFVASGVAYLYFGNATLSSAANLQLNGTKTGQNFGSSLCYAGDMNGDGANELFVGASNADSQAGISTGAGFLYFGFNPLGTATEADAVSDVLMQGSEITGSAFGAACARAYDLDADGFEDLLIGAPQYNFGASTSYGKGYVYFGNPVVFPVPSYQFLAGAASGLLGTTILGRQNNGSGEVFVGAPGVSSGSLYQYTAFTNPLSYNSSNQVQGSITSPPEPAAFANSIGANASGVWGDWGITADAFAVGYPGYAAGNGAVFLYHSGAGLIERIDAPSASENFGAAISSRP